MECIYHIVFIAKYRREVIYRQLRDDIRGISRKLCEYKGVEIVKGSVSLTHIHLCVKIPPEISVSYFMGNLKGENAQMIFDKHPQYKKKRQDRRLWATGYYVDTVSR